MKKFIVFFLGNNLCRSDGTGIMVEANNNGLCEGRKTLVVTMNNDRLPPPEGVETVEVGKFVVIPGADYLVVSNGGRTEQVLAQFALVAAHARGEITLEIVDLHPP